MYKIIGQLPLGVVQDGELKWEKSGQKVSFYPGSYFSPLKEDLSWISPTEDVYECIFLI